MPEPARQGQGGHAGAKGGPSPLVTGAAAWDKVAWKSRASATS